MNTVYAPQDFQWKIADVLSVFEIDKWTSLSTQKYSGSAYIYGAYKNVQKLLLSFSLLKERFIFPRGSVSNVLDYKISQVNLF